MGRILLGANYYPEDWDEDQIPYDIAKMKEAGITCARTNALSLYRNHKSKHVVTLKKAPS